jgi:hypothetical protein
MLRHRLLGFSSLLVVGSLMLAAASAQTPRPAVGGPQPRPKTAKVEKSAKTGSGVQPRTARASAGLVINATFDPSITSDPNGAAIKAGINAAILRYQNAFSTPITVNILFKKGPVGLGQSSTQGVFVSYANYLTALNNAKANNPALAQALATLRPGATNPVNGNDTLRLSTANARALGFSADPSGGQPDSIITLNTDKMNLTRTSIDPTKFDLIAVVSHEINEALGFRSALNHLHNGDPSPTGPIAPDDLYRYGQTGARSFDTALGTQAFYSIDGGQKKLARFNQNQRGDFSDWFSPNNVPHPAQVQDAFATPGATPDLGVELIRLAVLGYTPAGNSAASAARAGGVRGAAGSRLAGTGRLPSRRAPVETLHLRPMNRAGGPAAPVAPRPRGPRPGSR